MKIRFLSVLLATGAVIAAMTSCGKHSWEETQVLHEKYKPEHGSDHGDGHGAGAKEHGTEAHGEGAKAAAGHEAAPAKHE